METGNEQTKKCDGHCETCNINQRTYCASQMAYYAQQEISEIKSFIAAFVQSGGQGIVLRGKDAQTEEEAPKTAYVSTKDE